MPVADITKEILNDNKSNTKDNGLQPHASCEQLAYSRASRSASRTAGSCRAPLQRCGRIDIGTHSVIRGDVGIRCGTCAHTVVGQNATLARLRSGGAGGQ
jgi:hypothetical protein